MHHFLTSTLRTLLFGLAFGCALTARPQFILEHTYAGGSMVNPQSNQFFLLDLEASGWKYVRVDRANMEVALYHMDHTFWKSVPFTMVTTVNPLAGGWDILYISEHLFDQDDGLEFMFTSYNPMSTPNAVTQVVDEESGQLIFNVAYQIPAVRANFHQQQYPIRTTPEGTKMILTSSAAGNDSAYVYRLVGELSTEIAAAWDIEAADGMPALFPNPAMDELMIRVDEPEAGLVMQVIANDGNLVMSHAINSSLTTLDVSPLSAGQYMCRFVGMDRAERIVPFVKY